MLSMQERYRIAYKAAREAGSVRKVARKLAVREYMKRPMINNDSHNSDIWSPEKHPDLWRVRGNGHIIWIGGGKNE